MPMYDRICPSCGEQKIDCLEPIAAPVVPCLKCGTLTGRVWLSKPAAVIADDIPGGVLIYHGLCHDDGTPRCFYSNSEIARAAKEKGLVNHVEHMPARGSDKSKHTSRWF